MSNPCVSVFDSIGDFNERTTRGFKKVQNIKREKLGMNSDDIIVICVADALLDFDTYQENNREELLDLFCITITMIMNKKEEINIISTKAYDFMVSKCFRLLEEKLSLCDE
jgi:hypothetical protein